MAIVKTASGRPPRPDDEESPEMISADESDDEEEEEGGAGSSRTEDESDPSDADSGMESDEFDLSELGEANTEFCQVGNQSFQVPLELYDLPDLTSVLSVETWNQLLTEEERFGLAEFLPDVDQETLARTLTELFAGKSFHFGSPIHDLFSKLKGGMLDPRVVLYRRGMSFFQKREHYHLLRKYQNSMVGGLSKMRDAWRNYSGYGIEERLRLLNIMKSQKSLGYDEKAGDVGSDTDSENSEEVLTDKRFKMDRQGVRFRKDTAKGMLKVVPTKFCAEKEYMGVSGKHGFEKRGGTASKGLVGFSLQDRFDLGGNRKASKQIRDGDDVDEEEEDDAFQEQCQLSGNRGSLLKSSGKKKQQVKHSPRGTDHLYGDVETKTHSVSSQFINKRKTANQGVTIASYNPHSLETMSNAKYPAEDWRYSLKDHDRYQLKKGTQVDWSLSDQAYQQIHEAVIPPGREVEVGEWNVRGRKSRIGHDPAGRPYRNSPVQITTSYAMTQQGKKGKSAYTGRLPVEFQRDDPMLIQSDETESDSSEKSEDDRDTSPYVNKLGSQTDGMKRHQQRVARTVYDPKKSAKLTKGSKKLHSSAHLSPVQPHSTKTAHKSRTSDPNYVDDVILVKKTQASPANGKPQKTWKKPNVADKKRKGAVDLDHSSLNDMFEYGTLDENPDYMDGSSPYPDGHMETNKSGNKNQVTDTLNNEADHCGRPNLPLLVYSSVTKKRKGNADTVNQDKTLEFVHPQSSPVQQIDEPNVSKRKGKRKPDSLTVSSMETPDTLIPETGTADVEPEPKPQKQQFTLITPTKHTGFSFSIVHLLTAIRKAMITPHLEDSIKVGNHLEQGDLKLRTESEEKKEFQAVNGTEISHPLDNMDVNAPESAGQSNILSLTIQEIVDRVRTNPGDPCILETQEPLHDLVRGVLKIFSSKTAPLGAKGWKPLVSYEKSNKSWSWVGPVSPALVENDSFEEETSPEAWDLPYKTLVKLVDSFANWLKSGQETLKLIGSLPPPPTALLNQVDEKERFRDLRAQKSLNTINPSSEEVREYVRKEELLRYSIPDRAFSYTAADGKKSIVAPLRRGGGKPTSKARDHFMLKPDRPPHVTILCLVRDAAARLPGSIGTRADVCTLIRDSQYIVEDVSDEKVNQVVSGALDRLHYERDPCVQFDGDRKLWVYLHRDREEEDFEDDGTSSTKKWKRPRKDNADQPDTGAGNDISYPTNGDPAGGGSGGYDLNPDVNADPLSIQAGEEHAPMYNDLRSDIENIQSYIDPSSGGRDRGNVMTWDHVGLNPLCENKMLCQENSRNEDFEDEAFGRERPVGLLSASLL